MEGQGKAVEEVNKGSEKHMLQSMHITWSIRLESMST